MILWVKFFETVAKVQVCFSENFKSEMYDLAIVVWLRNRWRINWIFVVKYVWNARDVGRLIPTFPRNIVELNYYPHSYFIWWSKETFHRKQYHFLTAALQPTFSMLRMYFLDILNF